MFPMTADDKIDIIGRRKKETITRATPKKSRRRNSGRRTAY
jgi:hypothetical protein